MDIQGMLNAMSDMARRERSNYHLTLGQAISALSGATPTIPVLVDIGGTVGRVGSYRGYYADLAFDPEGEAMTAGDALTNLRNALDDTFEGYKGGDFTMGEDTPLWIAPYGEATGLAVVGISVSSEAVTLHTKQIPA